MWGWCDLSRLEAFGADQKGSGRKISQSKERLSVGRQEWNSAAKGSWGWSNLSRLEALGADNFQRPTGATWVGAHKRTALNQKSERGPNGLGKTPKQVPKSLVANTMERPRPPNPRWGLSTAILEDGPTLAPRGGKSGPGAGQKPPTAVATRPSPLCTHHPPSPMHLPRRRMREWSTSGPRCTARARRWPECPNPAESPQNRNQTPGGQHPPGPRRSIQQKRCERNVSENAAPHRVRPTPLAYPTDADLPRYPTP